jgi:hypothetical protein
VVETASRSLSGLPVSLKELQLPSIASLRAIAALKSPHLALVRPARIGLGFESTGANQKTLAEIEDQLGGPGRLALPYSLRLLLDALTGLGVLHRTLSFVHGEVQPEHVVLGDDGIGRLIPVVRAHWVRGEARAPERLYYLAPEKLLGDRVDVRSDVFSIGVMLWEAVAGQRLLEATDADDIIARLMGGGIPRPQPPERQVWMEPLSLIAERAVAVDPGRRFANVAEMKEALQNACSRFLASSPGMAEVFQNPTLHARNLTRESAPPQSQRVTLPPTLEPTVSTVINAGALDAAAARLALDSFAAIDLEDETTTKPRANVPVRSAAPAPPAPPAPVAPSAPAPAASRVHHVNTLLGVPPPFIEREPSPDAVTLPFPPAPRPPPVIISAPTPAVGAARPAAPTAPVPGSNPPPAKPRRAGDPSPLVRAQPVWPASASEEPSFELVRPRKSRRVLWLLLGAALAIGAFAARPWLARQVAAAVGAWPGSGPARVETAPLSPVAEPTPSVSVAPEPSAALTAISIASTPASPSASSAPVPRRTGEREEHIVIHDSVEAEAPQPATPPVPEHKPEPAPAAPPPPPPAPPPPSPAAPKTKQVPVSDADRYGI